MDSERLFLLFLVASVVGFGGLSSLPILRSQFAAAGLPADALLLDALAVGNISPGPNGLYMVAAGFFVAGFTGALVAVLALLLPPFLVLPLERVRARLLHRRRFRAALHSLALAVVALLAVSSATLVQHAATDALGIVMVIAGAALLWRGLPSLYGIAAAVAVGLAVAGFGGGP
jgi:chromate transporter